MKYYNFLIICLIIHYVGSLFQDIILKKILEKNDKKKNIMISPFSIYQVLSILANGAIDETQKEILQIIFPENEIEDNNSILTQLNNNFINILNDLSKENVIQPSTTTINKEEVIAGKKVLNEHLIRNQNKDINKSCNDLIFNNVNGLFISKQFSILNEFVLACENYNISIKELINAEQINDFCYKNTNGKIPTIIDSISPQTVFILVNAIYFKGNWSLPFKKESTKKLPFKNVDDSLVNTDTMYKYFDNINYYEDEKIQMISLPYRSKKLSFKMIILLPNEEKYTSSLNYLQSEHINNLNELISKLHKCNKVYLYLPKFKTEFQAKLNLILEEMNMKRAFSISQAQFDKMTKQKIFIDEIIHKTFIQVDEEGTEAAAVTRGSGLFGSALRPEEEYYMYVNHSFIYMIVSDEIKVSDGNYLIPFLGVVNSLEGDIIQESRDIKKNDKDLSEKSNNITISLKENIKNKDCINSPSAIDDINDIITNDSNIINNISSNKGSNIKLNGTIRFLLVVAAILII